MKRVLLSTAMVLCLLSAPAAGSTLSAQIEGASVFCTGEPIEVALRISNTGEHAERIYLPSVDPARGYPSSLEARIVDSGGDVLTSNEIGLGLSDWYSSQMHESTFCIDDPELVPTHSDLRCDFDSGVVTVGSGEYALRAVRLSKLIAGAPSLKGPLAAGDYEVTLRIDGLESSPFSLMVRICPYDSDHSAAASNSSLTKRPGDGFGVGAPSCALSGLGVWEGFPIPRAEARGSTPARLRR